MANTLLTSTAIAREFAGAFYSALNITRNIDTSWNSLFGKSLGGARKPGTAVNIPIPALGTVRTTWAMNQSDITERYKTLTINQIMGVDLNFTDNDRSLNIDDFRRQFLDGNAHMLAAKVDQNLGGYMYQNIANSVNSSAFATAPNASTYFLQAKQKILENLAPMDGNLKTVISPRTEASMVSTLAGQYNPQPYISRLFEKGEMPNSTALGLDWYMSQTLPAHTHGTMTAGTSPAVSSYATNYVTVSNVTAAGTLKAGDTISIASVYAVNYETKQTYGSVQQFVVTADCTAAGSGTTIIEIPIYPYIYTSGADQNVSAAPTTKVVTFNQTTANQVAQQDLIFHPKAFSAAFIDLDLPNNMEMAERVNIGGVSIRFVRGWDIVNSRYLNRMDVLFGRVAVRPEWACRLQS